MRHDVVVFLGPTLRQDEARSYLDAIYLPPAEQGSLVRILKSGRPAAVVLIDGVFARVPAIRHKEILWALSRNVVVFGAASMGALRAAELASAGMQGHGFIYRWYRLTPLADDDEVAVAMTPPEIGGGPLSEALINIRLTLRLASRAGVVTPDIRSALEELARSAHFVDRSYPGLLARARDCMPSRWTAALDRFEEWYPRNAIDQKRTDAIGLLAKLAGAPALLGSRGQAQFQMTEAWAHDLAAAGLWSDDFAEFENAYVSR